MPVFQAKYSRRVRLAIEKAYCDDLIRPVTHIHRYCEAGQLRDIDGEPIEPFQIPYATVITIGKTEARRRRGHDNTALSKKPPDVAIEELRQRLVTVLDRETMRLESRQKTKQFAKEAFDPNHIAKMGRALRELAALPPKGTQGRKPGRQVNGEPAPENRAKPNQMAGQIIAATSPKGYSDTAAVEIQDRSVQVPYVGTGPFVEDGRGGEDEERDEQRTEDGEDGDPGSFARNSLSTCPATEPNSAL